MKNFLKNEKLWCVVAGAAAVIVGKKVFTSPKTRSVAVTGLAKGMKLQKDAKAKFQSMKDDAADLCYIPAGCGFSCRCAQTRAAYGKQPSGGDPQQCIWHTEPRAGRG